MRVLFLIVACSALVALFGASAVRAGKTVDPATVTRPADLKPPVATDDADVLAKGEKLFDSLQLSENGLTCKSCHFRLEAYEESFREPYPHGVGMAKKRAGLDAVHADEMVQLCLVVTMDSVPLAWGSPDLSALTAYVLDQQRDFIARGEPASK